MDTSNSSSLFNDRYRSCNATEAEEIPLECDLCILEDQRIFYLHHPSKQSYWEPPRVAWKCRLGLPYGWEQAVDVFGSVYYIDHINQRTTYSHPLPPSPSPASPQQQVVLPLSIQHQQRKGEGGASTNVPHTTHSNHRRCRVRFRDEVSVSTPDESEKRFSFLEIPDAAAEVIRLFLENGQTKCLRYDSATTTVKDLLDSLLHKQGISSRERFALAVEKPFSASKVPKLLYLRPSMRVGALLLRSSKAVVRLRLAFVPLCMREFSKEDPSGFRYLYDQCVNDVVAGRFSFSMRYEACIRLAALHIRQVAEGSGGAFGKSNTGKRNMPDLSTIEREYGMATFVPMLLLQNVKQKELRRHIKFFLKKDQVSGRRSSHSPDGATERRRMNGHANVEPESDDREEDEDIGTIISRPSNRNGQDNHQHRKAQSCTPLCRRRLQNRITMKRDRASSLSSSVGFDTSLNNLNSPIGDHEDDECSRLRLKYIQTVSHLPNFGGLSILATYRASGVDKLMQVDPRLGIIIKSAGGKPTDPHILTVPYEQVERLYVGFESDVLRIVFIKPIDSIDERGFEFIVDREDFEQLILFVVGYGRANFDHTIDVCHIDSHCLAPVGVEAPPYGGGLHAVTPAGWNFTPELESDASVLFSFGHPPPDYHMAVSTTTAYMTAEANGSAPPKKIFTATAAALPPVPPLPAPQRRQSSILASMLTESVSNVFQRHRSPSSSTNRIRDSIRIHRQRHSIPNSPLAAVHGRKMSSLNEAIEEELLLHASALTASSPSPAATAANYLRLQRHSCYATSGPTPIELLRSSSGQRATSISVANSRALCVKRLSLSPLSPSING